MHKFSYFVNVWLVCFMYHCTFFSVVALLSQRIVALLRFRHCTTMSSPPRTICAFLLPSLSSSISAVHTVCCTLRCTQCFPALQWDDGCFMSIFVWNSHMCVICAATCRLCTTTNLLKRHICVCHSPSQQYLLLLLLPFSHSRSAIVVLPGCSLRRQQSLLTSFCGAVHCYLLLPLNWLLIKILFWVWVKLWCSPFGWKKYLE